MRSTHSLGYSLNVFPDETLPQLWRTLRDKAAAIQRAAFGGQPFPVELRFSARMTGALMADAAQRTKLREFLLVNKLDLITLNAFVPLSFHEPNVKERVYLPRWDDATAAAESRLCYTLDCATLLAELGSARAPFLSLSVPAGVLKRDTSAALRPFSDAAFALNLARYAAHARQLRRRTGRQCVVALEAEPGLTCERTDELVDFFERSLDVFGAAWLVRNGEAGSLESARTLLREYVGVNLDTCHQLVEGEHLQRATERLWQAGIPIFKVHVSNCLCVRTPSRNAKTLAALRRFYARSKFLHQTVAFCPQGACFALDLPEVFEETRREQFCGADVTELRVHYHMPLLSQRGRVPTMLNDVRAFVRWFARQPRGRGCPLIIETYTWLEQLGGGGVKAQKELLGNITRELAEVRRWLYPAGGVV